MHACIWPLAHRYFTVVENRRTGADATTQRQVLYLGEIYDSQRQAWRQTLKFFDEDRGNPPEARLTEMRGAGTQYVSPREKAMHRRRFKASGRLGWRFR